MNTTTMTADNTNANVTKSSKRAAKRIVMLDLKRRDWTRFGHSHVGEVMKGHHAVIVPGKSITLCGEMKKTVSTRRDDGRYDHETKTVPYSNRFAVGDFAEYDSYNLSFYGEIVSITEKTVTIRESHGTRVRKLSIPDFSSRNHDWSRDQAAKRNNEWSD